MKKISEKSLVNQSDGKQLIEQLIDDFSKNQEAFLSKEFNETEARNRFIDPFFKALGWEFEQTHLAPDLWDVRREYSQKEGSVNKKPDYTFRIDGKLKFFAEAKAPHVRLEDKNPAHQAKRYAFSTSGKAPVVILTNFYKLKIFNALERPVHNNPLQGLLEGFDLTYLQYPKKWDLLYSHFSKEAVSAGSLDILAGRISKNTRKMDDEFLADITQWREKMAESIANLNKKLNDDELNESVQRILDRMIFLRNLEDRDIEDENSLLMIAQSSDPAYPKLVKRFNGLNEFYNGLLFKSHFSEHILVDDKLIKTVIRQMCYPESPFRFDVIEPEILGHIYERFLGSEIRLVAKRRAVVEEKPEVRKAGGVYYTPQYIVDYIVKNTVGEKIEGMTPEEIKSVRIVDPACGSGSFLLGAFDILIKYHEKWYDKHRKNKDYRHDFYKMPDGKVKLTPAKKADILKKNIFGVDIDREATEVAMMSLYLKLMDNNVSKNQMELMHGHVLPDLTCNIKCGNSLIAPDFYDEELSLTPKQERKINVFDWKMAFPEVFKQGGFDCVIGNPPYVNIENLEENSKKYYFKKYKTCKARTDIYIAFIENNLKNVKKNGLLSFIIPYAFSNQNYGSVLREMLIKNYLIKEIVDTSQYPIFSTAKVKNIILFLQNNKNKNATNILISNDKTDFRNNTFKKFVVNQDSFLQLKDFRFETKPVNHLITIKEKLWRNSVSFGSICLVAYGARLNHKTEKIGKDAYIFSKQKEGLKPFSEGKNIERYVFSQYGWLDYRPDEHYNAMFPELFENEKIMFIRVVKDRLRFSYDNQGFYNSHTVINCVRIDKLQQATHISARKAFTVADLEFCKKYEYKFLLGLLNSELINWYFKFFLSDKLNFYPNDAKNLPIKKLDFKNQTEKQHHDQIVKSVETMLELCKRKQEAIQQSEKEMLQRRIDYTDKEIDNWVYKLYDLTPEEIEVVEKNA